uniref:Uncharacterized protein n=2 Tax=Brassica oleracea TaxID=3712 RepID=A0A0D3AIY5_BRAOL
ERINCLRCFSKLEKRKTKHKTLFKSQASQPNLRIGSLNRKNGFNEFHTDGGWSRRRGDAIEERRQAICHRLEAQRQTHSPLARRRNLRRLQGSTVDKTKGN